MQTKMEQPTAGDAARELLAAVNSGSGEKVGRAVVAISMLPVDEAADEQETEFRELLSGIAVAFSEDGSKGEPARRAARQAAALRMLSHIARNAL